MISTKIGKGSFRGVPFLIEQEQSESGGRRLVKHEYPLRDDGLTEDLGQSLKSYSINCLVIGDDHLQQANALISALITPGKGTLVHPYFKTLEVMVESYNVTHSTDHQRVSRFSITFSPAVDSVAPITKQDTQWQALQALQQLQEDASALFEAFLTTLNQVSAILNNNAITGIVDLINKVLLTLVSTSRSISFNRALYTLSYRFNHRSGSPLSAIIKSTLSEASKTEKTMMLNRLNDVVDKDLETLTQTPLTLAQIQAQATHQLSLFLSVVLVTSLAKDTLLALDRFTAIDEATATLDALDKHLERIALDYGNRRQWQVYQAVTTAQMALIADIRERASHLPSAVSITLNDTIPALVAGHRYAQEAGQWLQITKRNNIEHPLFCLGGSTIEVIK